MYKRILVTATTFPRWANDTEPGFIFYLSNLLAEKGHKVSVLVPHHLNAKRYELMGNVKVYRFPYFFPYSLQRLCYNGGILENLKKSNLAKLQAPLLFLMEFLYMNKIIRKEKIELVHAHWILPQGILAAICKKFFKIPFVVTVHAGDIFPIRNFFSRFLSKITLENCDYCTANSTYTKNAVMRLANPKNISVIPMGVDTTLFNSHKKNTALKKNLDIKKEFILSVGRLVEKKGIKYIIMALPRVLKRFPEAKLVVVGDGPEKDSLRKLVSELKIDRNVEFIGKIKNSDLPDYYATADVFVGPSIVTDKGDTEGLGIVFLEALASKACIIGSNVGGIPDIIKNKKTGLLVKEKNPEQLGRAIIKALSDKRLRSRLIKNGSKHVKNNFSWDSVAERFDRIIKNLNA